MSNIDCKAPTEAESKIISSCAMFGCMIILALRAVVGLSVLSFVTACWFCCSVVTATIINVYYTLCSKKVTPKFKSL